MATNGTTSQACSQIAFCQILPTLAQRWANMAIGCMISRFCQRWANVGPQAAEVGPVVGQWMIFIQDGGEE